MTTIDPSQIGIYFPPISYVYMNSNGFVATCAVTIAGDNGATPEQAVALEVGTSYCSPKDQFIKAQGRRQARKRLLRGYCSGDISAPFYGILDTYVPRSESMHKVAYRAIPMLLRGAPSKFDFNAIEAGHGR